MSRIRVRMQKLGRYSFLSHLDTVRTLERAIRRTGLRLAYSEGFHPHPKISFGAPLAVGITSSAELADIEFDGTVRPEEVVDRLNAQLPEGLRIDKAVSIDSRAPSLMSEIAAARYVISITHGSLGQQELHGAIKRLLDRSELLLEKRRDGDAKQVNVRPLIIAMTATYGEPQQIDVLLRTGSRGNLRPDSLVAVMREHGVLSPDATGVRVHRAELLIERDGRLVSAI